ncbi:ZrgA family zinc uptake protein [Marinobacter litoralis]|uniref:ZrgA family zinc uptake protein n=1 Tax=Marinobacter litoralis TaxID=187981 RepID=UPI0018EC2F2C|nr:DUF2796 domain-containing protein [Marinobacter litoralis]MBJ6136775.1 DUF2796 domain-containing protein [Marinobacter litoralis]
MKFSAPLAFAGIFALGFHCVPALAQQNLQAHQHGRAELQLAIAGEQIDLLLLTPAYNLVGFEHPPRSTEQHQTVDSATAWLERTALVNTDKQQCAPMQSDVQTSWNDEHTEHHDHGHDHAGHSDIEITQRLHCPGLTDATELETGLFGRFPGLEQLNTQWVGPNGQNAARLTPGEHRFKIAR